MPLSFLIGSTLLGFMAATAMPTTLDFAPSDGGWTRVRISTKSQDVCYVVSSKMFPGGSHAKLMQFYHELCELHSETLKMIAV